MTCKIKIIGTGISGLLTAYYLHKLILEMTHQVQIEIYEQQNESEENVSTISFAWLNSAYPSLDQSDQVKFAYDAFRLKSLEAWPTLNEMLIKDGISGVLASEQNAILIDQERINSIYVFFDPIQRAKFLDMLDRLKNHSKGYQAKELSLSLN